MIIIIPTIQILNMVFNIYQDDMKWFGPGNNTDGDIYTGDTSMTGSTWRMVIN